MKIILIGATGTIGSAVHDALEGSHEIVRVSRTRGDVQADISDPDSIRDLYEAVGAFDAVVCAAGNAEFGNLQELSDEDFATGVKSKLMGQVNLVRYGLDHLQPEDAASFTLVSGILSTSPVPGSSAISLANSGLEGFVRAAALDVPEGVRVNVVSPPWISETLEEMGRDPAEGIPAANAANAFVESVEGDYSGDVLDARDFAD